MAGIPGMGQPKDLENNNIIQDKIIVPEIPQINSNIPQGVPAVDYESIVNQAFDQPIEDSAVDYESVVNQAFNNSEADAPEGEQSFMEQVSEFPFRARASFAKSTDQVQKLLEERYGKENVRKKGDDLQFKNLKKEWVTFNKNWELGDIADLTRFAAEEIPAGVGTGLGVGAGFGTLLLTKNVPAAAGVYAGLSSAGAGAGVFLGDIVESALSIPEDKERNQFLEYGIPMILAPIAGLGSDWLVSTLSKRTKNVPVEKLLPPSEVYKQEINGAKEGTEELVKLGYMQNIPGTDTPLILSQYNPSNPIARAITKEASKYPQFAQTIELQAQGFDKGLRSFISTLGNLNTSGIGPKVKNYLADIVNQEGSMISSIRKEFVEQSGDKMLPVKNLMSKMEAFRQNIGFVKGADGNFPKAESVAKKLRENAFDPTGSKIVTEKSEKIYEDIVKQEGSLTADQLMTFYDELNNTYKYIVGRPSKKDFEYQNSVRQMRKLVADELIEKVGEVSGKSKQSNYFITLKRYEELMGIRETLENTLDNNNVNSSFLAKAIFDKGPDGLDNLKATKALLVDRPDLMEEVNGQFIKNVIAAKGVVDPVSGIINGKRFTDELNKFNKPMLEEMFGKEPNKIIDHFTKAANAIHKANDTMTPGERIGLIRSLVSLKNVPSLLDGLTEDYKEKLVTVMSKNGIENFLKGVPEVEKPFIRGLYEGFKDLSITRAAVGTARIRKVGPLAIDPVPMMIRENERDNQKDR